MDHRAATARPSHAHLPCPRLLRFFSRGVQWRWWCGVPCRTDGCRVLPRPWQGAHRKTRPHPGAPGAFTGRCGACADHHAAPPDAGGRTANQADRHPEGGCLMQIVRVYTGADGESHFEDLTPEQFAQIVNNVGEGPITLNRRPSPSFSDYHQAPRRQYVVNLSGVAEFETADGSTRRLFPGDVLVAEDLTGHGHIAPGLGGAIRRLPGISPGGGQSRAALRWGG